MISLEKLLTMILIIGSTICLYTQSEVVESKTTGPENGSLVIVGGGYIGTEITAAFIELAGGIDARIVVIPTAGGRERYDDNTGNARHFTEFGAKNISVLHTYDRTIADSDEFVKPLHEATGVWFSGGRQWRLVDAYKDTQTEKLIKGILEKGGVVGGSSAGATILGSYLVRGDTKNNQIMMGDHEEGFGYVKNLAIDQHVIARNRHFDMFDILKNRPELLGISIDESTAVVVRGNQFEVLGDSYVIVYDGTFWSREGSELKNLPVKEQLFYFLRDGDHYDMKERVVVAK